MEKRRQDTKMPILSLRDICKSFSGIKVLDNINLDIYPGEIHALVGENGAGKSTMMKIISAEYSKSSGTFIYQGEETEFKSIQQAKEQGISIIHQEFNLFPNLTVAENVFLESMNLKKGNLKRIPWKQMHKETEELLDRICPSVEAHDLVRNLSVQAKQAVEIVKAIHANARVLIMDEPSAALADREIENMFAIMRALRQQGVAIIYVSHRLNEVFEIADKVTILRNGRKVDTLPVSEIDQNHLINLMIGTEIDDLYGEASGKAVEEEKKEILRVENLSFGDVGKVSFSLHEGEILSLFGILGSGTQTCAERIFGVKKGGGALYIQGKKTSIRKPLDAINAGISYVTGDRKRNGIVAQQSVQENLTLLILNKISGRFCCILKRIESKTVKEMIDAFHIKCASPAQAMQYLSGGNQQKVVISKWLANDPKVLILVEPTRGVDIGAKTEIYGVIRELAEKGMGIILISSDMPETLGLSDRILVMQRGTIVKEHLRGNVTQKMLLREITIEQEVAT